MDGNPKVEAKQRAGEPHSPQHRLLRAATSLFGRFGFQGTSVRALVDEARCTKPVLYYHFGNKEGLFLAAVRHETAVITKLITQSFSGSGTLREQLLTGLESYFQHVKEEPWGVRLLLTCEYAAEGQPVVDVASMRAGQMELLRAALRKAVEQGEATSEFDVDDMCNAFIGIVHERMRLWLMGEPLPEGLAGRIVGIFLRGIQS